MSNITRRAFLSLVVGAIVTAATPEPAEAIPYKFRKCPRIEQNGINYILWNGCAIVTKCPARKSVTIPNSIKHSGKRYTVSAIWPDSISRKTKRVVLKARNLETIEDVSIWRRKNLTIICSDADTRAWLRRGSKARIK